MKLKNQIAVVHRHQHFSCLITPVAEQDKVVCLVQITLTEAGPERIWKLLNPPESKHSRAGEGFYGKVAGGSTERGKKVLAKIARMAHRQEETLAFENIDTLAIQHPLRHELAGDISSEPPGSTFRLKMPSTGVLVPTWSKGRTKNSGVTHGASPVELDSFASTK